MTENAPPTGQPSILPTGLKQFRRSKVRASIRRLVQVGRQYELDRGEPINFEVVREVYGPRLSAEGILATDTACLAAYLNHMGVYDEFSLGGFGESQCSGAVLLQANSPIETEFAAYDKISLYKKMEEALVNPRKAPQVLQWLLTHERVNKNGERRLVQHSFSALVVGILKRLIDGLDFATLTYSFQYLDMKHEGIRRSLKSWNEIAKALGEQYLCQKRKQMIPTARFWDAVIWLKKKGVIQSKAVAIKDRTGDYKAIPSFKSLSKDFLIALGLKEERLEELRTLSSKSTTERIQKRIQVLTNEHFRPLERLQAAGRHLQKLKEKGIKIARTLHGALQIPVIHEFNLDELYPLNSS